MPTATALALMASLLVLTVSGRALDGSRPASAANVARLVAGRQFTRLGAGCCRTPKGNTPEIMLYDTSEWPSVTTRRCRQACKMTAGCHGFEVDRQRSHPKCELQLEPIAYAVRDARGCSTSRISCHVRLGVPVAFDPPTCASVWDPANPPAIASQQVVGTVAYLDSVGYFSGGNGPVLGGTTPFSVYEQVAIASTLGMLDQSSTPADLHCLALFQIASSQNPNVNEFGNVLAMDITQSYPWAYHNVSAYVGTTEFVQRRLCPCYNRMPRELFEHMNCRPFPRVQTYSQTYATCQAVDTTGIYTTTGMTPLVLGMPLGQDAAAMANWQGCHYAREQVFRYSNNLETVAPGWPPLFDTPGPEACTPGSPQQNDMDYDPAYCPSTIEERFAARRLAYDAAVDNFGLAPSVHPQITVDFGWLDAVAGTCTPVGANGRLPDPC